MQLRANSANKNKHVRLAFPSHKRNIVNSDVMSFPALNPDFQAKWNAAPCSPEHGERSKRRISLHIVRV